MTVFTSTKRVIEYPTTRRPERNPAAACARLSIFRIFIIRHDSPRALCARLPWRALGRGAGDGRRHTVRTLSSEGQSRNPASPLPRRDAELERPHGLGCRLLSKTGQGSGFLAHQIVQLAATASFARSACGGSFRIARQLPQRWKHCRILPKNGGGSRFSACHVVVVIC